MRKKVKKEYAYQFKTTTEIESCCTCPASELYPDNGGLHCKILKMTFDLGDDENFPDNCPMEETNLPEDFGHR